MPDEVLAGHPPYLGKRFLDLVVGIVLSVVALPLVVLLAVCAALSPGLGRGTR
jgi:lipopolysaccharide/colanic/teichoic acid biosynthesis glycosyltransferase